MTQGILKVFISYARKDSVFADRLVTALEDRGFDVLIDRRDLPALEDWERELLGFIRAADTVVMIVSPHSVASKVCQWEVDQVGAHGKRLAPVVIADFTAAPVPEGVARINYLFFTDEAQFEAKADELARALNTDVAWLKDHTRLGELARRWEVARAEHGARRAEALLLRGDALAEAEWWISRQPREAPPPTALHRAYVQAAGKAEKAARVRARRARVLVGALAAGVLAGLVGWWNQAWLGQRFDWLTNVRPYVLSAEAERALKPKDTFKECAKYCPEMVVVPAGEFMMGNLEGGMTDYPRVEAPLHKVTIAKPFAVAKFEITFEQWDACVGVGECRPVRDNGWGKGARPVINVNWEDAKQYVAWLSKLTGKPYRLLSEAEWEYAAPPHKKFLLYDDWAAMGRYAWLVGNSDFRTQPVGSKLPNAFGLHDMLGNVREWVEDCFHLNYIGAPVDGSAWTTECAGTERVMRGGAFNNGPDGLRPYLRGHATTDYRFIDLGFRVARTLAQ